MRLGDVANAAAAGNGKPLDGVRVLALEQMQALPWCTQLLARLGADVVKVEHPTIGDSGRESLPAMADPHGRSVGATFLRNNLNKRSIAVDLKADEGRQLVLDLAPRFDVVAENSRAGAMARLGLGYADVAAVHPRVVYLSISGFGNTVPSPYDAWPAYAPIAEAMSGIYELKRRGDEPPVVAPVGALGDIGSALFATVGVLAALRHRDRTGLGQYIDIAMLDAMVSMTDIVSNFWSLGLRGGELGPLIMNGFRAADGWFIVQAGREPQFAALVRTIGRPEWATDERFATRQGWVDHLDDVLRPAIEAWAATAVQGRGRATPLPPPVWPPAHASPTTTWCTTRTSRLATCSSSIHGATVWSNRCSSPAIPSRCPGCRRALRAGSRGSVSTPAMSYRTSSDMTTPRWPRCRSGA